MCLLSEHRQQVISTPNKQFARETLGHNSKAVHAAYAKKAEVRVPSLDQWERQMGEKVVQLEFSPEASQDVLGNTIVIKLAKP
jgi:hypothetical protein